MQIDKYGIPRLLEIFERANEVCFWDLETSGLQGDYQAIVLATVKPYKKKPKTCIALGPGKDRNVVKWLRLRLAEHWLWVTQNGKLFDVPYTDARLLYHKLDKLPLHYHLDVYQAIKNRIRISSKSQGQVARFLNLKERKLELPTAAWSEAFIKPKAMRQLVERCESDCAGLEAIYDRTKHLVREITR